MVVFVDVVIIIIVDVVIINIADRFLLKVFCPQTFSSFQILKKNNSSEKEEEMEEEEEKRSFIPCGYSRFRMCLG